jgi:hypothetical protein
MERKPGSTTTILWSGGGRDAFKVVTHDRANLHEPFLFATRTTAPRAGGGKNFFFFHDGMMYDGANAAAGAERPDSFSDIE